MRSARPRIETIGNGVEFVLGVDAQIGALGQILAQQPVGVLAGAALPGTERVAEIDLDTSLGGQIDVAAQLLALVVGQGVAHRCGDRIELDRKACQRRGSRGVSHLGQQHQPARALDQHAHRGLVACALDEIAFPVPWHDTVIDLRRAHVDADHVGDLAAPVGASRTWQSRAAPETQTGDELAAQLPTGLCVDGGVDGFVGHVALTLIGKGALKGSGNLLGRPFPLQQREHNHPGHAIDIKLGTGSCGAASRLAGLLRNVRTVGHQRICVARNLTADGRGRAMQHPGHGPDAASLLTHACNGHAVFRLKLFIGGLDLHVQTLGIAVAQNHP